MPPIRLPKPTVVLTDIEGTTTSIRFWQNVLAPFVLNSMRKCLVEWWDREECFDVVQVIRDRAEKDWFDGDHNMPVIMAENKEKETIIDSILANMQYQMKVPKHNGAVKSITLLVWLYGYEERVLQGHAYKDVAIAFKSWRKENISIFAYASGSSLAQELLLCKTIHGNLRQMMEAFFDAHWLGRKNDPASYRKFAKEVKEHRSDILFISDSPEELKASAKVGLTPVLVIRSHNKHLGKDKSHGLKYVIKEFTDLEFN